jgi:hypothetical protein
MDMDDGLDTRSSWEEIVVVWIRSRTPRLTSPVLSAFMSMCSMLGYGFEKSDGCAQAEKKLEWSVSRIEGASPNTVARLRGRCGMNARRVPTLTPSL